MGSLTSVLADLIIRLLVVSLSGEVGSLMPGMTGKSGGLLGGCFKMEDGGDEAGAAPDNTDDGGTLGVKGTGC